MTVHAIQLPSGPTLHVDVDEAPADRPTLLLLNGAAFHLHQWDRLVAKGNWRRHFRIVRFDYAGTGHSSPRGDDVSVARLTQETVELLDALELERVHLYGVSQGTIVAQGLAAEVPERLLSVGGYGWYHGAFSGIEATLERFRGRVADLATFADAPYWDQPLDKAAFEALWERAYRKALLGGSWSELSLAAKLKDILMRRMLFGLLTPTSIAAIHGWFAYSIEHLRAVQPTLAAGHRALDQTPVLLQHAVNDETLEVGMARELAPELAAAELREYEGAFGHASIMFNVKQGRAVVDEHIDFVRRRAGLPA